MKFKYPKKITIGSVRFKIYYGKGELETHFSYGTDEGHKGPHIYFGLDGPSSFLELIIHELKEIIQLEQDVRHRKRNEGACVFYYGHVEHTDLCARLAGLIPKFIK